MLMQGTLTERDVFMGCKVLAHSVVYFLLCSLFPAVFATVISEIKLIYTGYCRYLHISAYSVSANFEMLHKQQLMNAATTLRKRL